MDELYYITDEEGQKKLRDLFIRMGGKAEVWDRKYKKRRHIDTREDYEYEMRQRPHYGKTRPG